MDFKNISKETPIKPEIELDGGYAYCTRCLSEINVSDKICSKCGQMQDWSWIKKGKNE